MAIEYCDQYMAAFDEIDSHLVKNEYLTTVFPSFDVTDSWRVSFFIMSKKKT